MNIEPRSNFELKLAATVLLACCGAIALLLLAGCSTLLPSKRTENASITTAEKISASHDLAITRAIEGEKRQPLPPAPNVTVSGTNNAVKVELYRPPDYFTPYSEKVQINSAAEQGANSNESASSRFRVSLPLGVSLILIAVGLLLLVFAWNKVRQSSAAVNAGFLAADGMMANRIKAATERAMRTTEPVKLAELNAEVASLHADRASLK